VSPSKTRHSFATLEPANPASLIAAAADVALLVDEKGVIRDVSVANTDMAALGSADWVGRRWTETVTIESRPKVEALLQSAGASVGVPASGTAPARAWRHVNHSSREGANVPVLYSTVPAGPPGQILAIGRDLRQLAEVQQRLIAAQQSLERDYLRLRQMEVRYRVLFQAVSEALLIVDAATLKVVEANPAATEVFGETARKLVGRPIVDCFDPDSHATLRALLENVRSPRRTEAARLRLASGVPDVAVSAATFRQDSQTLYVVRVTPPGTLESEPASAPGRRALLAAVHDAPDALVVTDPSGRILYANASFVQLVQFEAVEQVMGQPIDRWLGRSGVDVAVLLSTVRHGEAVRLFPTVVRAQDGGETQVEISASSGAGDDAQPWLGFLIRDVGRRLPTTPERAANGIGRPVEQLTELVGRVPLKDIVSETTDLIEQLCIEAALKLTRDNRAAAAEMLGLSRQSLYVKLRRYGLGDYPAEAQD